MRRCVARFELGVNWIDTAAVYGLGHSEEVVGRLLKQLPAGERPLVFTKCGLQWDPANPMVQSKRSLRPEGIRDECDASLRRLGVERIDLFQFHWPDETGVPVEESWAAMARLVEAGKVRLAGLSNFNTSLLDRCEAVRHVDSLQAPYSLIRRDLAQREIPWCAAHGTGVIVYSPMQSGILTDAFSAARVAAMASDDWRRAAAQFREPNLSANIALRDALKPVAQRHATSVSSVAVAWTLSTAGSDRRDRRGSLGGAGRRLDRCGATHAHRRRSRRDRRGRHAHAIGHARPRTMSGALRISVLDQSPISEGVDRRRRAPQLDRPRASRRVARLHPLLGGGAPRHADARVCRAGGAARAARRGDQPDQDWQRRRDAAALQSAQGRRDFQHAQRAGAGPCRSRPGPRRRD